MAQNRGFTAEAALACLADAMDEGALVFDERHVCRAAGRRIGELFGVDARGAIGRSRAEVLELLAGATDRSEALRAAASGAGEIELTRPAPRTLVWTSRAIDGGGQVDLVRDVTHERAAERLKSEIARKLRGAAALDELTGLPDRQHFEHDADREHRRAQRAWEAYAVARVDVDGMGAFNAKFGREAGDGLLRRLAEDLRAARREYDVVARWGEDEFILLLPGAGVSAVGTVLRRVVAEVRGKRFEGDGALAVSVSAGGAVWMPPSGERAEDVVKRAGVALQAAQIQGAGSVEVDAGESAWAGEAAER